MLLILDAALARCSAALAGDDGILSERRSDQTRGHALLAPMAAAVLDEAGVAAAALVAVAVTVGPGSFTGLRASIALAQGIALAAGCKLVGVSVGEAMAAGYSSAHRSLWTAIDSRRGRVFLDRGAAADGGDRIEAVDLAALPRPDRPVALAGDAAVTVAAWLAAAGADVALTDLRLPLPLHVAQAARRRLAGVLPPRAAQPLYVDPPEAKLPAGGLRAPPVAS